MKNYSKSKIRNWLNKKLLKRHYVYKIVEDRIYQIEYYHSYYVAYYEKPSIKSLIWKLKHNHYTVWEYLGNVDIKNNKCSKVQIASSMFDGFLNRRRKEAANKILNAKISYWERNIINKGD